MARVILSCLVSGEAAAEGGHPMSRPLLLLLYCYYHCYDSHCYDYHMYGYRWYDYHCHDY